MNHKETVAIKGMHCASCAITIEKTLNKTDGVDAAQVNYGTETAAIQFDPSKTTLEKLSSTIEPLGYTFSMPTAESMNMSTDEHAAHLGLKQSKEDKLKEISSMKKMVYSILPLAVISIIEMTWSILAQFNALPAPNTFIQMAFHQLMPLMATYALFVVGKPYLLGIYRFVRYGNANMDTLIGIGTSVAYVYSLVLVLFSEALKPYLDVQHLYFDATIVVIAFITLGKYLEARAKIKTGDAIEKLLNLQAKTALVIRDGKEQEVAINEVVIGDHIIVKPGSNIPVDGILTEGESYVDESMITGESMPIQKTTGDTAISGTVNTTGTFTFKATKIGSETLLAKIITMVQEAQGSRAPIQALADKISSVFVPIVLVLSVITLAAWLIIGTGPLGFSQALTFGLTSFVGILVIACPCALGLATPTAIIVGVGKGAKEGILIKDAATLEKLHKADTIIVDKTGTITKGKPEVVTVYNQTTKPEAELISILATLEQKSEHPIAYAITSYAKTHNAPITKVTDFEIIKGKGLKGSIDNVEYFAGNTKLMVDLGHTLDFAIIEKETTDGKTPVFLATNNAFLGSVYVADAIKPEATQAIKDLHKLGMTVIMVTGDMKNTAQAIAREVGIDEVIAEALPEEKLTKVKSLQRQGRVVVMAGDGVNDAPALAQADIGIAMGTGTDVAIETAGITLLHGDISKIVKAIRLSKITMTGIKQNLFWAFIYNIIGIPLASGLFYPLFGWLLSPVFAGLAMALSSVSVVGNSLRLKTKKL
ncbi:MAG: cadmium-translocating P-type ATPase [Candidatus Magasanikbacteria bacterium]|nr:cadmium-translocating P-type ATPase [Candidatus Magasanikbacteria bacterium]